jgi:hypothetical protein
VESNLVHSALQPLIMPIMPAPGDHDEGDICGMTIGRGNVSIRRKPDPVPLCPPQTPTCCPDANPGRRGGKPATNCLSLRHGPAEYESFNIVSDQVSRFYPSTILTTIFAANFIIHPLRFQSSLFLKRFHAKICVCLMLQSGKNLNQP